MDPRIRQGIIEAAQALGVDPVDIATAISYETGGTFDPMQQGPTTQWGQHIGLIQFGEPQRAANGVDLSSPDAAIASQLGPNGAVARYLKAAGVQPGMGMMDIYSAINAGQVGRYDASDANNGGAPGSVRDKVEGQMSGHRANALALLGEGFDTQGQGGGAAQSGQATDRATAPAGNIYARLAMAYANGKMTPEDEAIYERGMAEGVFPKAEKSKPAAMPDPLAIYAQTAMRPREQQTPFQPLQVAAVQNATPLQRFPGI